LIQWHFFRITAHVSPTTSPAPEVREFRCNYRCALFVAGSGQIPPQKCWR
jgi:hypothetical protein